MCEREICVFRSSGKGDTYDTGGERRDRGVYFEVMIAAVTFPGDNQNTMGVSWIYWTLFPRGTSPVAGAHKRLGAVFRGLHQFGAEVLEQYECRREYPDFESNIDSG